MTQQENYKGRTIGFISVSTKLNSCSKQSISNLLPKFVSYDEYQGVCQIINSDMNSSNKETIIGNMFK